MRYEAMAEFIRSRAERIGLKTTTELHQALEGRKVAVHWNMVSRWLSGEARPQDDRLEGLLDLLGVVSDEERHKARELAYMPPTVVGRDVA